MARKNSRGWKEDGADVSLFGFPSALETSARHFYDLVCRGAEVVLRESTQPDEAMTNPEFRRRFYVAAHRGFARAQDEMVSHLVSDSSPNEAESAIYRVFMDTIAWQLIQNQLYLARRLYRGHKQPSLRDSNYKSVWAVAKRFIRPEYHNFALMSDLTSFVQVGDLLNFSPDEGFSLFEVKEGAMNKKIMDFIYSYPDGPSELDLEDFRSVQGEKAFRQLQRVQRQSARMKHIRDLAGPGDSVDPDTGQRTLIPCKPLPLTSWDSILADLLEVSISRSWAFEVVDDCLFVGAYRGQFQLAGCVLLQACITGSEKNVLTRSLISGPSRPIRLLFQSSCDESRLNLCSIFFSEEPVYSSVSK